MRKLTKRSAAVAAAVVVAVGGGGAAWAYGNGWFNGTGTVTAQASAIQPVTATITGVSDVWPGHAVNASVSIGNFNQYPVKATAVKAEAPVVKVYDNASAVTADTVSGECAPGDAKILLGTLSTQPVIPAGQTVGATFANFVGMDGAAHQACAGKIFKVTFKLDGEIVPDAAH